MAAFAAVAVLSLAACGSSSSGGEETLHAAYNSAPDYLDPALSFTLEGWTAMYDSYIPLLTFAHRDGAAGTTVVPGLAKALPQITDGGRTYTLYLRPGLHYSSGQPVRASDFKHEIERVLTLNSAGSPFYTEIVGAERFAKRKHGGIPGIVTDDRSGRIVIHLERPRATFTDELALLFAAPVPRGTPAEDLTAHPPPATGPYEIVESQPGRGWRYVRNPAWSRYNAAHLPQIPGGNVAAIDVSVVRNASTEVSDVERGEFDWMQNPPPPDRLPALKQKYSGTQLRIFHQPSVFYFWMNTRRPPFDDVRVRRAVNYALDPRALERIYAGTMTATQQVLPPQLPGYHHFELYPHNLAKARKLIAEADPKDRSVTVWTDNAHPNDEAGEYYEGVLREIGLQPKLKVVNAANYFSLIGNASTPELDTGWANWLEDYPHPLDYFRPQLSSAGIAAVGATNWAHFAQPRFDAEIERLAGEQLGPRQEAAYARLDREIMKQAPWAPFGNLSLATFVSSAVELDKMVINPVYGVDLATLSLR
ncbi:MAG TPA: ABC transporter substrate-binding protein [Solirubrobacterales bacterium]